MLPETAQEELAAALDAAVADVFAAVDWTAPPVDAIRLARTLGFAVAWDDRQSTRARFVRAHAGPGDLACRSILLRPEPRVERRHWAVAHEIGEQLAHGVAERLDIDASTAAAGVRERLANELAARILLPTAWFAAAAGACDWDLPALKKRFSTASHELIARRMLDFPPAIIITVFDNGGISFRRSNQANPTRRLLDAEVECLHAVRASSALCVVDGGAWRVQGWPVYEADWKREILRTSLPDFPFDDETVC
jgi:predicted transcriptional regulator